MVAVGSRFALLATLCTVAVLSFNPLLVGAAVIDTRHSGQPTVFERERHGLKQQVIRNIEHLPADQLIRVFELPAGPYKRQNNDDCSKKVFVNGDANRLHLACRDWHDHNHNEVVDGNRHRVRTRRELLHRSPRHSRPAVQPRSDPAASSNRPEAVLGTVEVTGSDGSNGQDRAFGQFLVENRNGGYDVGVSSSNQTMFYLVGAPSPIAGVVGSLPLSGVTGVAGVAGVVGSLPVPLPDTASLPLGSLPLSSGQLPVGGGLLPVPGQLPVGGGLLPVPAQAPSPGQAPTPGQAPAPGQAPSPGQAPTPGQAPSPGQAPAPGQAPSPGQLPLPVQLPVPLPAALGQVRVTLQTKLPNRSEWSCCSYERNPDGPRPMTMEDCKASDSDDDRFSQIFLFEPGTGTLQPVYNGTHSNSTSTSNAPANSTSTSIAPASSASMGASREQAPDGNQSVKMIWRPFAQGSGARSTAPETQTVTVTVTSSASASSGGLREATSSTAMSSAAGSWSSSAAPVPSSAAVNGLKVEVAPNASWSRRMRKGAAL